ncbi:MAG TPA: hypothetical protein VHM20_06890 [Gammaproteobacteria bacterium]|jgi:uncharacterized lipoprotein|nr:hypothetical protein [Gammaproteobacteria bacterium]
MLNIKSILIILLMVVLSSCSRIYGERGIIPNRDTDYLRARSIAPIKIPPGLSSDTIHNEYPISERNYPGNVKPDLVPPGLNRAS